MIRAQHALPRKLAALSAASLLMFGAQAVHANAFDLTSGGSSSAVGQGEGASGGFMDSFITDGQNAFTPGGNGQSFYLSGEKSGDGILGPFSTGLVTGDSEQIQPSGDGDGDLFTLEDSSVDDINPALATYNYSAGPIDIEAVYLLDEITPGLATLTETFTISWVGEDDGLTIFDMVDFSFFLFTNPDLDGDADGDSASFDGTDTFTHTDGSQTFTVQATVSDTAEPPTAWELNTAVALLTRLDDPDTPTPPLGGDVFAGPGDLASLYQFKFLGFSASSEPIVINVTKTFNTGVTVVDVPEPASIALLAAGGLLLLCAARRAGNAA